MLHDDYRPSTARASRGDVMIDEYVVNYDEYAGPGDRSCHATGGRPTRTPSTSSTVNCSNAESSPSPPGRTAARERLLYDFLMKLFGITLDLGSSEEARNNAHHYLLPEITFFRLTGAPKSKFHP